MVYFALAMGAKTTPRQSNQEKLAASAMNIVTTVPLTETDELTSDVLRMMVHSAPVAIVVVDARGVILLTNTKATDLFHYAADELAGQHVEMLMPERYRAGHRQYRDAFSASPHVRAMGSGLDLAARRKDGSEFPIEVGLSYFNLDGNLLIMASLIDITRRKQTEDLLERRVQERTRELERRRQVADSLRDILAILNSNRPLRTILEHIVQQACQLLQADASAIYQIVDGKEPIIVEAATGLTAEQLADAANPQLAQIVHSVVNGRGPRAISDDGQSEQQRWQAYTAQLAVPLRIKTEVYGGLMLYYVEPRRFSAEDIELAVAFGDQAVLAIENARLRAQAERSAIVAERNRIARDLHDSVTQTLFTATLVSDVIPKLVQRDPEEGARQLEELRQLTRGALAEMRTLLLELRPATLTEVSTEELLRQLSEAARGRARIPIDLSVEVDNPLPPDVKVAFYYIAQEALNNVIKHARARHVEVVCRYGDDGAMLVVRDDGQGFDPRNVTAEHLGLAIMRERVESIYGMLDIDSAVGRGTMVRVRWRPQTDELA